MPEGITVLRTFLEPIEGMTQISMKVSVLIKVIGLSGMGLCFAAHAAAESVTVRVAAFNVECSRNATPEQIGEMFKPFNLDIVGFNEAPGGDWTDRVGRILGMNYSYVGQISSANHRDKYKAILSRTPLENREEYGLKGRGWNPASTVKAVTKIEGVQFAFYSLHICASGKSDGQAYHLATDVLPKETIDRIILVGDFNNEIGDPAMKTIEESGMRPTWKDLKTDLSQTNRSLDKLFTWNALDPKQNAGVIDHILYNTASGACGIDGGIIELPKPLSDHKPVWAKIIFPRQPELVPILKPRGAESE